jgi:hypothetical protein
MRVFKLIIILLTVLAFLNSCDKDNPTGPKKDALTDYVVLGVSNGQPSFTFPKETAEGYVTTMYSNIEYDIYGRVISFDAEFSFPSGNDYNIEVTEIKRSNVGTPTSYKAAITATIDGKTISGTLIYP